MSPNNAKSAVQQALKTGRLTRPDTCEKCGRANTPARDGRSTLQAHHHDYDKPLDVHWLCAKCHRAEDRPQRGEKNSFAKLTNAQAEAIRNDPRPQRVIAAAYGVDHRQIGRIKRGESYREES